MSDKFLLKIILLAECYIDANCWMAVVKGYLIRITTKEWT